MQAVWKYVTARQGETGIIICGSLEDVLKLADWFSKYNIVKKRDAPSLHNKKYQIKMTLDKVHFVAPTSNCITK